MEGDSKALESMKRIVLFYPAFSKKNKEKTLYVDIPLSITAIANELSDPFEVIVIDERIDTRFDLEDILKNTFLVGISATTSYQIINGLSFSKRVRGYNPDIKIVWGGWHPSLMPYETIQNEFVDIVIKGQGEKVFKQLADTLYTCKSIAQVPNILYKEKKGSIVENNTRFYEDLQMPVNMKVGYESIHMPDYIHSGWGNKRILGYESSRGCPFSCKFCSIGAVFKRKWYGLSARDVVNDICYLKQRYDIDAIHFFDNNFFVDKKRSFDIADLLREKGIQIRWDGTIVTKQFLKYTDREINFLKKSGFYRIIAGIESGDEEVLAKINKRHENKDVLELVRRCGQYGIMPSLSFMIGFPWNPEKDMENTIRFIEQIKEVNPQTEILLFIFSPYLGTPLYQIAKNYHMIFPDHLEGWAEFTYDKPNTPWVTKKLIKKMKRYLEFFGTKELDESQRGFYKGFKE